MRVPPTPATSGAWAMPGCSSCIKPAVHSSVPRKALFLLHKIFAAALRLPLLPLPLFLHSDAPCGVDRSSRSLPLRRPTDQVCRPGLQRHTVLCIRVHNCLSTQVHRPLVNTAINRGHLTPASALAGSYQPADGAPAAGRSCAAPLPCSAPPAAWRP